MNNLFVPGLIPSRKDDRDMLYSSVVSVVGDLPRIVDLNSCLGPIKNQGFQGSCSAMTASQIREWQECCQKKKFVEFSPQWVYNNRENQESEGMSPRDTMKILQKKGIVTEEVYPYGKIEKRSRIIESLYKKAKLKRINGYTQIRGILEWKHALALNGPVYLAVPVFHDNPIDIWNQLPGESLQGYHAMVSVGYNDDEEYFDVRNSWGPRWGIEGHTRFPYSDFGKALELWTVIDF